MVTLETQQQLKPVAVRPLGYDFALLGLSAREARVEVIRSAAEQTASRIQSEADVVDRVEMLSELAVSTYRLLDPRRRKRTIDRIQLSIGSESDPKIASVSAQPLVAAAQFGDANSEPLVSAELVDSQQSRPPTVVRLAAEIWKATDTVSTQCESKTTKMRGECRLGLVAVTTLTCLAASISWVAWILFN